MIEALIGGLILIAAFAAWGISKYKKGRKAERKLQERIDHEAATHIRNRVDGVGRVSDDDLEYRD